MSQKMRFPVIKDSKKRQRGSRKLLLLLFVFFIIILVILFLNSSLSKIASVEVEGNHYTTVQEVRETSGIKIGESFFTVHSNRVEERLKDITKIEKTVVSKKFPGRVFIHIFEYPNVAFQINDKGLKEAVLANGLIINIPDQNFVIDKPILTGWKKNDPIIPRLTKELSIIPDEFLMDISEITPDPSPIYPEKIKLYTNSRYEVITTVGYLAEKLYYLEDIINQLEEKDIFSGILTLLESDTHTPFEEESTDESTLD